MNRIWFVIYNLSWGLIHNLRYQHYTFDKNGIGEFRICEPRIGFLGHKITSFTPDLPDNVTYNVSDNIMHEILTTARTGTDAVRIIYDAIEAEKEVS